MCGCVVASRLGGRSGFLRNSNRASLDAVRAGFADGFCRLWWNGLNGSDEAHEEPCQLELALRESRPEMPQRGEANGDRQLRVRVAHGYLVSCFAAW